jgi:membrane peptidoglycan carboxypeptidase
VLGIEITNNTMKSIISIKRILIFLSLVIFVVIAYYGFTIFNAYQYTINTILVKETEKSYPLQLKMLSPQQLDILLKVEDPCFFEHHGVDFSTPGAGITTITQSLVKQLYFEKFNPGIAKIKQTLIAYYVLDPLMSKESQLNIFINTIYLGKNAFGFEQAANYYFHKNFTQLSEDQYVSLIAMIIAPVTFNIEEYPARNKQRVERIKLLINGKYKPKGLFDMYYGKLDRETQTNLPPLSYFSCYY